MFLTFLEQYPFILAFLLGLIPALIWLWFWIREDTHPEPAKMVALAFLGGMLSVLFVIPLQKFIYNNIQNHDFISFTLWATIEEVFKFALVYVIALRNKKVTDEPVDDIIYLIISALGFVTLENTLFLTNIIKDGNLLGTIINGNLRFIGASLLHIMSSATIGICMGLSFYKTASRKRWYFVNGLIIAIVLHTAFNLFIISGTEGNIFWVFGMVWIGVIALLLLFEKVKHINKPVFDNLNNINN
jgi:RsiW-degrading membrane proteinase PrsW (M82 family)